MKAPDYSLGSRHWGGLSKLTEEAGEVIQVAGKIMGNGGQAEHWDGTNLRKRMGEEVADLSAAVRCFILLNGYDGAPWVLEREQTKLAQFLQWHADNLEDKEDGIGNDTVVKQPKPFNRFERFLGAGGDLHRQIYWCWRVYPRAVKYTCAVAFLAGGTVASWAWILASALR